MTEPSPDFAHQRSYAHDLARSRRMLTVEDVDLIGAVVGRVPEDEYAIVVDLGASSGTTALAALCARSERVRVFSFDVSIDALNWTEEAIKNAGFSNRWRGFEMSARQAAGHWGNAHRRSVPPSGWIGVDVLLHDAGHSAGDVSADLRAWATKLVPGAGVWVHDYAPAPDEWGVESYPAVKRDVDRLVADGVLATRRVAGLGWLGVYVDPSRRAPRRERRAAARALRKERRDG